MIVKCKYYNNHHTAALLMIDDIVPVAISNNEEFGPFNDWGYLKDNENSLYSYLIKCFFEKHPEIRGTIFLPLLEHENIQSKGYRVLRGSFDKDFLRFLKNLNDRFDLAFHGIRHTWEKEGRTIFEFENHDSSLNDEYRQQVYRFQDKACINFNGGKFPGYKYNEEAIGFFEFMNYKWLASNAVMINKKHILNTITYIPNTNIVQIPSNLTGDIFNLHFRSTFSIRKLVKKALFSKRDPNPERYLGYLYEKRLPIVIQEHYQNQRTDGKRQQPNLYDDIYSLNKLYYYLKGADIWHTTCSDLAHYYDSYENTSIKMIASNEFEIEYSGNWEHMVLSFFSKYQKIENSKTGEVHQGLYKDNVWVFNNLTEGNYIIYGV